MIQLSIGKHLEYRGYGTVIQYSERLQKFVGNITYQGLSMLINGQQFPIICKNLNHFEAIFHSVIDDFLENNNV